MNDSFANLYIVRRYLLEIDHIFICIDNPVQKVQLFEAFGLTEGETNSHPGQGTANKRFFFHNFYIELLYLIDAKQARSSVTAPTKFYERLTQKDGDISPFGLIFRPNGNDFDPNDYPSWDYKPKLLPPPLVMKILDAPISDPMYLYFDFLTESSRSTYTKTRHNIGFEMMTSIKILQPTPNSKLNDQLVKHNILSIEKSPIHMLEITFDGGTQGKTHDFGPAMPLIFKW